MSDVRDWGVFRLYRGDNLDVLRSMSDCSVDSIVTDPPYGLSFMGKKWDYDVPPVEAWAECLRVLKPGGHVLAFAGTRTQHRMAGRIEDAGFEIRDMIAWVYGSGFPKSLDVSKALDAAATATAAWVGWGTALKPALEPITVARKPLVGTVAANVLSHGVGALNIDASRAPTVGGEIVSTHGRAQTSNGWDLRMSGPQESKQTDGQKLGRWPANLIHDGSDEVVRLFPAQADGAAPVKGAEDSLPTKNVYGGRGRVAGAFHGGRGSAARFFYCAKAGKADREEGNNHPTVKPTALMLYLVRLVTPAGGLVLDPWMGSGSTGKAAVPAGFRFVGIDRDDWLDVAERRISRATFGCAG